jgi:ATP adenylyltransferase
MKKLWAPWRMQYIKEAVIENPGECIFCLNAQKNNDRERLVLFRGKTALVVMNKFPYNNGHLLIAPYRHIGSFSQLSDEELLEMQRLIDRCISAMEATMHPQGFNIGVNIGRVAGAGVEDHIHYHLLPRWNGDTNYLPIFGEVKVISEDLWDTYVKIKGQIDKLKKDDF